jgi:hypothetical protein
MKTANSHGILTLIATLVLFATSCSHSTTFSTVLEGGFDPEATFRQHGYTIQNEARGEGIRNSVYGYGWGSWCGNLTGTNQQRVGCEAVATLIRDELNKTLGHGSLDQLTVGAPRPEGHALTGMLLYNQDQVHGDMYVWLTPAVSNSAISYVIFLREERLK